MLNFSFAIIVAVQQSSLALHFFKLMSVMQNQRLLIFQQIRFQFVRRFPKRILHESDLQLRLFARSLLHLFSERKAKFRSRSDDAVTRVYDAAGNVIETHEHAGDFKRR
jgi:hypothetical protein